MEPLDLSKPLELKKRLDAQGSVGFFEEESGQLSMMRLTSFLCIISGIILSVVVTIAMVCSNQNANACIPLIATLMTSGVVGKVAQRFAE